MVASLDAITGSLARVPDSAALHQTASRLREGLKVEQDRLRGHDTRSTLGDTLQTVGAWLWHARFTASSNVYGPTPAQEMSLQRAHALYADIAAKVGAYEAEYEALQADLDEAAVPWTPGRPAVP